jgi:pyruvate/2-oxoglutarate dehydrogenase complex dihydrolipoamide acyltransferase (E2) component
MRAQVEFPRIGFSMNEGPLSHWLVADGEGVKDGQPEYVLESDVYVQIESPERGRLDLLPATGETYQVGAVLAEVG